MNPVLEEKYKELTRHTLGLPNDRKRSYRNHYLAGDNSNEFRLWTDLVRNKLAESNKSALWGSHSTMFRLTYEGAALSLEKGEQLCEEDFGGRDE